MDSCTRCDGSGSVEYDRGDDQVSAVEDCPRCHGSGNAAINPYRAALEALLVKASPNVSQRQPQREAGVAEGQRRGIRRALAEIDRVWEELS